MVLSNNEFVFRKLKSFFKSVSSHIHFYGPEFLFKSILSFVSFTVKVPDSW
ncbi:hypothetical protein LEP1GSC074_1632 [Leptospira noguchii str. Hook]|uniref:Uncharacterized protein n=1 Tax=Leptospira noguchii serovar Autumnalis str. ZUN142 TaxID=1085540 RepID=M6UAD7_9LEPT|nr:hypothetical protein LEP1GSC041_1394 [Leptospira noguchii str. 2006001870]EMO39911.1 hypothetical protein LEP1GSC186_1715 [Leptospira noguchii serovar Autumnalis str. ZUN142]EMS82375.1 hypothetical protein LEP1GSC074_1632 [Leptospira noguchii str. Hook]